MVEEERSWRREGGSGFIFALRGIYFFLRGLRGISWAFRPGVGPGLFDPCVVLATGPKTAAVALAVARPSTAGGTGPRWTWRVS